MNNYHKRLLNIKSGRNFRELGGYRTLTGKKIKYHKLLRTGNLADLLPEDTNLLENYNVKLIIDFRSEKEKNKYPDIIPNQAKYEFNPVFSEDLTNASKPMEDLEKWASSDPDFGKRQMFAAYNDMINSSSAQNAYRHFLELLLANNKDNQAALFHCTAGKDRTGFGALLILSALGIPFDTIKKDYLLTNTTTKDFINSMLKKAKDDGGNDNVVKATYDIQSVCAEYLDYVLNNINNNYGSIHSYLRNTMKLSRKDILDLRKIYLED